MSVSIFIILLLYSALYPVIPTYFMIPGIGSFASVLGMLLLVAVFTKKPYIKRTTNSTTERTLLIFSICTVLISLIHGAVLSAFWFFTSVIMGWAAFILVVDDECKFKRILDTLIIVSGILSILAVIEAVSGYNPFLLLNNTGANIIDVQRMGLSRAKSFTYQAITFGNYLTLTSSLCVYRIVNCRDLHKKRLFKFFYIMMWLGTFATVSRSTILFFIVCQILLGLSLGFGKLMAKVFGVILLLVAGGFIYFQVLGNDSSVLMNVFYLIMSVFDESYAVGLSGVAVAEGNRLDLYSWVWDAVQGHLLFGLGPGATFSHDITYGNIMYSSIVTKTSIEVEYLKCLFHYGFIGLISKVAFMISILVSSLKRGLSDRKAGNLLSFEMTIGCAFLTYFLSFFTVMQDTESRIFYIMVFLLLAKRRNNIELDS